MKKNSKMAITLVIVLLIVLLIILLVSLEKNNLIKINFPLLANSNSTNAYYEVKFANENSVDLLIKINNTNGIKQVEFPDGNILNANNKINVGIDFKAEKGNNYQFKIKAEGTSDKILSINTDEIYASIPTIAIRNIQTTIKTYNPLKITYSLSDKIEDNIIGIDLQKSKYIFTDSETVYSKDDSIWNNASNFTNEEGTINRLYTDDNIGEIYYLHILAVNKTGEGYATYVSPEITVEPVIDFELGEAELSQYYGNIVSNYTPTKGSNWRLFFADSNFVYLMSDIVATQSLEVETEGISSPGASLNSLCNWWTTQYIAVNNVRWGTNTDNWEECTDMKDSNNKNIANWAIGGPTIELFAKSFNATHTAQISVTFNQRWGYYINGGTKVSYSSNFNRPEIDSLIYKGNFWICSPCSVNASGNCLYASRDDGVMASFCYRSI